MMNVTYNGKFVASAGIKGKHNQNYRHKVMNARHFLETAVLAAQQHLEGLT